jgi:hypothetical protein
MAMMVAKIACRGVLAAALCVMSTGVAVGQTLPPPMARQAAEASEGVPTNSQNFSLTMAAVGAYDDNLVAEGSGIADARTQKSGSYSALIGGGTYAKRFRFFRVGATEQSVLRYYPTLTQMTTAQHSLGGGFGFRARGSQLQFNQSLAYRPFFSLGEGLTLFSPEPGQFQAGGTFNDSIVARTAVSTVSSVSGSQALSRTTTLSGSASYDRTSFKEDLTASTFRMLSASLAQKVTRYLSLVGGYGNQQGTYRGIGSAEGEAVIRVHNIDAGMDYNRPVGRTRKTTIGFTTGSTIARDAFDNSQFRFIGSARLNREIGRSWHATGAFNRGVSLVAGFPQPFFANAVAADVAGMLGRRIALSFNGGYSKGEIGFSRAPTASQSYTGTSRVRFGLSRTTGFSAEYAFYQYTFDGAATLPAGVPPSLHRQGLRFGFDLFLPVIR